MPLHRKNHKCSAFTVSGSTVKVLEKIGINDAEWGSCAPNRYTNVESFRARYGESQRNSTVKSINISLVTHNNDCILIVFQKKSINGTPAATNKGLSLRLSSKLCADIQGSFLVRAHIYVQRGSHSFDIVWCSCCLSRTWWESRSCCTVIKDPHKCVIRKHAMFNQPPPHRYWNDIERRPLLPAVLAIPNKGQVPLYNYFCELTTRIWIIH